jgi:transcriptional regulator with XRE-family HTH domain
MRGAELKARRTALDLTQAELAEKLEVAANTVARWERGERAIPPYMRWALEGIEYAMVNLSYEARYQRNLQVIERHQQEARDRWERMTPEERAAVERWFGQH